VSSRHAALTGAEDALRVNPLDGAAAKAAAHAQAMLNRPEEAIRHLTRAVIADPEDAEAWCWLGHAASDVDDPTARIALREAIRRGKDGPSEWAKYARTLIAAGAVQQGYEIARGLLPSAPSTAVRGWLEELIAFALKGGAREGAIASEESTAAPMDPWYTLQQFWLRAGVEAVHRREWEVAERALGLSLQQPGDASDAHAHLADTLLNLGRYAEAREHAAQVTLAEGNLVSVAWIEHLVGLAFRREGRDAEAVEHLQRAVELHPDEPIYQNNLGVALLSSDPDRAAECFARAIALDPGYRDAVANLSWTYASRERYVEALEVIERAVAAGNEDGSLDGDLAWALMNVGRSEEAIAAAERVLARQEEGEDALCARKVRASCLWTVGRLREAEPEFLKVASLVPEDAHAQFNVGSLYVNLEQPRTAVPWLRRALELCPRMPEALIGLGEAHLDAGDYGEAIEILGQVSDEERLPVARWLITAARVKSGDVELALRDARRWAEEGPEEAPHWAALAFALFQSGEIAAAAEALRKAEAIGPEAPSVETCRTALGGREGAQPSPRGGTVGLYTSGAGPAAGLTSAGQGLFGSRRAELWRAAS
jgi:tetratricopeptide (TPR) repeat protein